MIDSSKADRIPLERRQATFADGFAKRLWAGLAGRKLKWLAEETGISTSMLSDYGKGGKVPGADKAVAIADALKLDVEWLLTGRGGSIADQLAEPGDRMMRELVSPRLATMPVNDDDVVEIDQIDLRYGLGGAFVDENAIESEPRSFSRAWLRSVTDSPPSSLFWATGRGNSMAPTIEDGEIVLGDRSQTTPRDDDLIWACVLGEIGMIKRLRVRADHVKILSDNPLVPDDVAHPDDNLRIVGRIVVVLKNL